jgi:hypothetical protein
MSTIMPVPNPLNSWSPFIGEFFFDLAKHLALSDSGRDVLASDTAELLSRCLDPMGQPGRRTGLVTGYVQSGKTRSIESLLCVARDNGYRMAIVLTGTSNPLLVQSKGRLERDLGIEDGVSDLGWTSILKPNSKAHQDLLGTLLSSWDADVRWESRTPLLAVLKNASNIVKLTELLKTADLSGVPVLVIDDEADQASLDNNARAQRAPTSTYRSIEAMRSSLPFHTYLQYTATPQAPLLISISDALAPEFVHVLQPGDGYTGGQAFFGAKSPKHLVVEIPPADLAPPPDSPVPSTFKEAFRLFLLGVASGLNSPTRPVPHARSMFVHPSRLRDPHERYEVWAKMLRDDWKSVLSEADGDPEKIALLAEFELSYANLAESAALPSFAELSGRLLDAVSRTVVQVVNGKNTEEVRWKTAYPWVLIGGQSIDRGFTVEGLTVTYMPRPIGDGNADNFQQRARFFGYRQSYLGICRVYMDGDSNRAFSAYVEHEELMRSELMRVQRGETTLKEWKRLFILDERMRPTRTSVLSNGLIRVKLGGWQYPRAPHLDVGMIELNNEAIEGFVSTLKVVDLPGFTRHRSDDSVLVSDLLDALWPLEYATEPDSRRHIASMLALKAIVDRDPDASARVILMDELSPRERTAVDDVLSPLQGPNPAGADRYPGDAKILDKNRVTLQLHRIKVKGQTALPNVLLPAIKFNDDAVKTIVNQQQT